MTLNRRLWKSRNRIEVRRSCYPFTLGVSSCSFLSFDFCYYIVSYIVATVLLLCIVFVTICYFLYFYYFFFSWIALDDFLLSVYRNNLSTSKHTLCVSSSNPTTLWDYIGFTSIFFKISITCFKSQILKVFLYILISNSLLSKSTLEMMDGYISFMIDLVFISMSLKKKEVAKRWK